ncbi:MAG: hypothetical protein ABSE22_19105 [Xanthobacteraceae bacterium]
MSAAASSASTLHFDLSHAPQDVVHTLFLAGKEYVLTAHTPETRALHAAVNALLAAVPPNLQHHISHFAEGVQLPNNVALMFVQHPLKDPNSPLPSLSLMALHIPTPSSGPTPAPPPGPSLAERKLALLAAVPLSSPSAPTRAPVLLGAAPPAAGAAAVNLGADQGQSFKTPLDAAMSIVSMHPELMHFDAATAAHIQTNHVANAPGLNDLALSLSAQGPAEANSGWARITPCLDAQGDVAKDASGAPICQYTLSDETGAALRMPIKGALRTTKNDTALKDKVWGQNYGVTSVNHSAPSLKSGAPTFAGQVTPTSVVSETPQPTPPSGTTNTSWTPNAWSPIYGLNLSSSSDATVAADGSFSVNATNNALRHLNTCVDFIDDMGNVIADSRQSLQLLSPGNFLMGIPLPNDPTTLSVQIPDKAAGARIYFGTLGTGSMDFDIAGLAVIFTGMFEIALPTFILAAGAAVTADGGYCALWRNKDVIAALARVAIIFFPPDMSKGVRVTSPDPEQIAIKLSSILVPLLIGRAVKAIEQWILTTEVDVTAEKCIPFIGLALYAVSVVGTLAQLAETTAAITESPAVSSIDILPTMTLTVAVSPDPLHSVWPSVSRKYRLIVQYQGGTFMHLDGEMSEFTGGVTSATTVSKQFTNIPGRGMLKVYAVIYSNNWWICGYASSGDWQQVAVASGGAMTLNLTIKEQLVPLSSNTQYSHNEKLAYNDTDKHHWVGGTDTTPLAAPTATLHDLDDTPDGHHLAELVNITINDEAHMLGYCWRASGQGIPMVGDDATPSTAQMYAFQNISYLASPESQLKATNRGQTSRPNILYDQFGPIGTTNPGNNFYLDVVGDVYHLRRIEFDAGPFDLTAKPLSWGKFTQPHLDAIVVHPGGYVAAASWMNSKLEILTIPTAGLADDDPNLTVAQLCSGAGVREGLLQGPTAMAVTPDGMLLVLETTNARIQAFDITGAPVQTFAEGTCSYMALKTQTGTVTYLDIGTESKGYIYVLSYLNDGTQQSDYNLDIYDPTGAYVSTTNGLNAAKMVVSMWRDVYALNYEVLLGPNSRTEPSVSQWIPSTPAGTDPNG